MGRKKKKYYNKNKSLQKIKIRHKLSSDINPHKRRNECKFYDVQRRICLKKDEGFNKCQGAYSCSMFRLKQKSEEIKRDDKDELSLYDETYIELPMQESIHEARGVTNPKQSNSLGTYAHIVYLNANNGKKGKHRRRDKRACVYYERDAQFCKRKNIKCMGSTYCKKYVHR